MITILPLFRYSVEWNADAENYFDIDPVEGTISSREPLDREATPKLNIIVVATKIRKYTRPKNTSTHTSTHSWWASPDCVRKENTQCALKINWTTVYYQCGEILTKIWSRHLVEVSRKCSRIHRHLMQVQLLCYVYNILYIVHLIKNYLKTIQININNNILRLIIINKTINK